MEEHEVVLTPAIAHRHHRGGGDFDGRAVPRGRDRGVFDPQGRGERLQLCHVQPHPEAAGGAHPHLGQRRLVGEDGRLPEGNPGAGRRLFRPFHGYGLLGGLDPLDLLAHEGLEVHLAFLEPGEPFGIHRDRREPLHPEELQELAGRRPHRGEGEGEGDHGREAGTQ